MTLSAFNESAIVIGGTPGAQRFGVVSSNKIQLKITKAALNAEQ
jgi:hypothetical protein